MLTDIDINIFETILFHLLNISSDDNDCFNLFVTCQTIKEMIMNYFQLNFRNSRKSTITVGKYYYCFKLKQQLIHHDASNEVIDVIMTLFLSECFNQNSQLQYVLQNDFAKVVSKINAKDFIESMTFTSSFITRSLISTTLNLTKK